MTLNMVKKFYYNNSSQKRFTVILQNIIQTFRKLQKIM